MRTFILHSLRSFLRNTHHDNVGSTEICQPYYSFTDTETDTEEGWVCFVGHSHCRNREIYNRFKEWVLSISLHLNLDSQWHLAPVCSWPRFSLKYLTQRDVVGITVMCNKHYTTTWRPDHLLSGTNASMLCLNWVTMCCIASVVMASPLYGYTCCSGMSNTASSGVLSSSRSASPRSESAISSAWNTEKNTLLLQPLQHREPTVHGPFPMMSLREHLVHDPCPMKSLREPVVCGPCQIRSQREPLVHDPRPHEVKWARRL